ncbi:MAG: TetR/AcrR family transcriptional regulator [Acidimicrobiales bacterium]
MRSAINIESASGAEPDPRARRRAARRSENRTAILDAAERVFGEHGIRDGSLRQIAVLSGFSPAGIYLFFENKQHLLAVTLTRRGAELVGALQMTAEGDLSPLDTLHRIIDVTSAFFEAHPDFRGLVRHITGGASIVGPSLAEYASDVDGYFRKSMMLLAGIVGAGQEIGEIRTGSTVALAHLYSVLVNEHVLLGSESETNVVGLTHEQFHGLVDGALRNPR